MQIFDKIIDLKSFLREQRAQNKSIGFVPTMGALHAGHLALIEQSNAANDITVCSIYVNPTQFNNPNDLAKYPRTFKADVELLGQYDQCVVFAPQDFEMYPEKPHLVFDFGNLELVMEGKFRPGHFNGVAIVVAKLFHIVHPNRAYFGQKDLQQCLIVKQLVKDLSFDLELIICPTVRESDNLAMSSRNLRMDAEDRALAGQIPQILFMARDLVLANRDFPNIKKTVEDAFAKLPIQLEYFQITNADTLLNINTRDEAKRIALCIAAYLGDVRLIDNIIIE
ncbi:MAG: pantoate--beta-alanine ligase [Microscillaceae bacterium]|jgi:pantoate--beta-alanine ligase|nr:pantoate--beta-alanine ligase [Microscillaceae bacterium]